MNAAVAREISKHYRQVDKTEEVENTLRTELASKVYNGKNQLVKCLYVYHNVKKIIKSFKNDGFEITCDCKDLPGDEKEYLYIIKW